MPAWITDDMIIDTIRKGDYIPAKAINHISSADFENKYGAEALKKIDKKDILGFLFGTVGQNSDSLTYNLENNGELEYYGKAQPGFNTTKVLNYSNNQWNRYKQEIKESDATEIADEIRWFLIELLTSIRTASYVLTAVDIKKLIVAKKIGNQTLDSQNWLKKYLTILYPDKFMLMLNEEHTRRIFDPIGLPVAKDWFENSRVFAEKAAKFNVDGVELYHVINTIGGIAATVPATGTNHKSFPSGQYITQYATTLLKSQNIIFRGAPGTGKSFLAKQIAADIVSGGKTDEYDQLTSEQQSQIGFVQFHPSYDYSDFVEGLRPVEKSGILGFELRNGIFKEFADRARKNFENSQKAQVELEKEFSIEENKKEELKNYVFIIDEINRGEISKILGELFFAIDPGYRGKEGSVFTQYANLHDDPNEKFYIPQNVYIIGTMNDIDRSVDTFDFAMRRRFRFIEIKAEDTQDMLDGLHDDALKDEAIQRMNALNAQIEKTEGLSSNYHIGAAYFLKLKHMEGNDKFDELWSDYLEPLLQEYVTGMYDDKGIMKQFKEAYQIKTKETGDGDESDENQ